MKLYQRCGIKGYTEIKTLWQTGQIKRILTQQPLQQLECVCVCVCERDRERERERERERKKQ
jgi:hypothetical protein